MATRHDPSLLFTQEEGWLQLGGIQALVRLPLDQIRADRRRGLKAAMFIAGYRGSPVGGLDQAYIAQHKLLAAHDIVFCNGLNEDLAATAVWGTQMLHSVGKQKFDAVLGTWYGKAPGVDRSGDALKHGNYTGIQKNGGGARDLRRRSVLQVVVAHQPIRAGTVALGHSVDLSRQSAGHPRLRPARLHAVARFGLLDRTQDRHQRRRRHGQRGSLAGPRQADHSGGRARRQAVRAAHEPRHERARRRAGDGVHAVQRAPRDGPPLRARQQPQSRSDRQSVGVARHHHGGQDVPRPAPGVHGDGHADRRRHPSRRHSPAQDGHAVPDGAARSCATSRKGWRRSS